MEDVTEISKRDIVSHKASTVSPMPQGLLDSFEGGGDRKPAPVHRVWRDWWRMKDEVWMLLL